MLLHHVAELAALHARCGLAVILAEVVAAVLRLRGVDVKLPSVRGADEVVPVEEWIDPPDPVNAWAAPAAEQPRRSVLLIGSAGRWLAASHSLPSHFM